MFGMFNRAESFNQPLNNWDVSNETDMERMFRGASSFNQPLNDWNVSNVHDMFVEATSFNHALLGTWSSSQNRNDRLDFFWSGDLAIWR